MTKRRPKVTALGQAQTYPPGDILKLELDARGWTQVELAEILGRPPRVVSEIVSAKRAISPETAKGLAAAFGTSPEMWMNLEMLYQLSKAKFEDSLVARRAKLYGKFPVKEMLRRGWVDSSDNLNELENNFLTFFAIKSLDDMPVFSHAAKRTEYDSQSSMLQLAWLNRAKQIAKLIETKKFTKAGLKSAIAELQVRLASVKAIKDVPIILSNAGVRLVVVEHLPRAKIDGACFWLDKSSPVIAMSLRYDRVDNFWHTLFHEIDHILRNEGRDQPIVDVLDSYSEDSGQSLPASEKRANKAAANFCIPSNELDVWLRNTSQISAKRKILAFADKMHVHPGILVGQLQRRGKIPYSFHRNMLEKIRHVVIDSAKTDGFGKMIQPKALKGSE
jgi:HTH-type transcriptional regulator/antitoxin HigA